MFGNPIRISCRVFYRKQMNASKPSYTDMSIIASTPSGGINVSIDGRLLVVVGNIGESEQNLHTWKL